MIIKYLKKKHQDFKIKQATKKFEKRKNQYYNIYKYRQNKYKKLSHEFLCELRKRNKISFEEYQKLSDDIFNRQNREAYKNFMRKIWFEKNKK